ncbi:MAG: hypothetical protein E7181_03505 [Erysipelotrichaceae bacterium]|jgi:pyocin large subunit-like protein|nr:hypothetical protein [Erysipelotrichaceae bacterium]
MATKGASLRYGNTNGAHHRGEATQNINYPWAKDFNKKRLDYHFERHGKEFGAKSRKDYAAKAVHFANEIDRQHYKSVVDKYGSTYKYDPRNSRLAIITKDGYVVTYHHTGDKFTYTNKKGKEVTKWIKR